MLVGEDDQPRFASHASGLTGVCLALAFGLPGTATACEPIFPLAAVFGGPTFFTHFTGLGLALGWLVTTVGVKCMAFVRFERRLAWPEAVRYMVLANVLSSLIGFVVALAAAVPAVLFVGLPVVYLLSLTPARRLVAYVQEGKTARRLRPALIALSFPLLLLVTWLLFGVATQMLWTDHYLAYWLMKFVYVSVALCVSILLTSLWEESVVARLAARRHGAASYLLTVTRANYVTFGLILLVTAVLMAPKRLQSRGFVAWISDLTLWVQGSFA